MSVQPDTVVEAPAPKKVLRIRVVDHSKEGNPVVNVKVPIAMVKWGLKMGAAFSPRMKDASIDWESVSAMIEHGEVGRIVEVEDEAERKTVEVWVE